MKTIMYLFAALLISSCSGKKSFTGEREVLIPCSGSDYQTDSKYFRENGMGESPNLEIAVQKATTIARSKIASSVHVTVKVVTDNYLSSYEGDDIHPQFRFLDREKAIKKTKRYREKIAKEDAMLAELGLVRGSMGSMPKLISFNGVEDNSKFQSLTREITNRSLKGVRVICKKVTQSDNGNYRCFVCLEMSSTIIVDNLKEASSRAKLKTDFEYEKYLDTFEKEMNKIVEINSQ